MKPTPTGHADFSMRRTLLALTIAAFFAGAQAAPTLPQVVAGQASFSQQGNVFSITNTPNTIINWQSFSVDAGAVTRFVQQSASSSVLNRIIGQDPSQILGALQSNGHVFLINPNGIVFGRDARVDVGGLVASSLNLSNADFLAGNKNFTAVAGAGSVSNAGQITTSAGGQVFLVAPSVDNRGIITSPKGDVILAAGQSVRFVEAANPSMQVVVSAPADAALNLGQVIAQGGRIGIYGALVRQRGTLNANSAVLGENGNIVLKASRDATLEAGSVTSATGAGQGGQIQLLGERVALTGDALVDASGLAGGGTLLVGGDYQGKNAQVPNAQYSYLGKDAVLRADAIESGNGGKVIVWADQATRVFGTISAQGGASKGDGGFVETSGKHMLDFHARVNLGARAGKAGTLLLDPDALVIVGGTGDGGGTDPATAGFQGSSTPGTVEFADSLSTVYQSELEGLNVGNIVLEANKSITATGTFDHAGALILQNNTNLTLRTRNGAADIGGLQGIDLVSGVTGALSIVTSGTGSQTYQTGTGASSVAANIVLPAILTQGASVSASGSGNLTAAAIGTGGANGGGAITLNAAGGNMIIGADLDARTGAGGADGAVMLTSAGSLEVLSGRAIKGGALTLAAGGILTLDIGSSISGNGVTSLSASALVANGNTSIASNGGALTIDATDRISLYETSAIASAGGALTINALAPNASFTSAPGSSLSSGSGPLTISADNIELGGAISAATALIEPHSPGRPITVGSSVCHEGGVGGCLAVTGLRNVAAPTIWIGPRYGSAIAPGNVYVAAITAASAPESDLNAATAVLGLGSGGTITQGGPIEVATLGISATGAVVLNHPGNMITTLAAETSQADFSLANGQALTLAPLASNFLIDSDRAALGGVSVQGGDVTIHAAGNLLLAAAVSAPQHTVDLAAGGAISGSGIITGGTLTASAGAGIAVQSAVSTLSAVNSGADTAIDVTNTGALTVQTLTQPNGGSGAILIDNTGPTTVSGTVRSDAGAIRIAAHSPLTVDGSITSAMGNITLVAGASGSSADQLHINQGATVSTSGALTLEAGDAIVLAAGSTVSAGATQHPFLNGAPPNPCIATPSLPECVPATPTPTPAPTLSVCIAAPATAGCSAVLPTLAACSTAPTLLGCSVVLPTLASCTTTPTAAGCSAVLPSLATCTTTPTVAGCSAVLPTLAICTPMPTVPGCSAVLPTFATCVTTPTAAGCSAVLPSLASCVSAPTTAGCSAVLPSLSACVATPTTAGCLAVLPSMSFCVAAPTTAGCGVVLPSLAACITAPSTPGCSAVLPTLAQCITTPKLTGCATVLASVDICLSNPATAGCAEVLPPGQYQSNEPVATALNSTVNAINAAGANNTGGATMPATSATVEKKDETKDGKAQQASTEKTEATHEAIKKTFCN